MQIKKAKRNIGFVAQEVKTAADSIGFVFCGSVPLNPQNDCYTLNYEELVVPLVKAVQEQQVLIRNMQNDIGDLRSKYSIIESELNN